MAHAVERNVGFARGKCYQTWMRWMFVVTLALLGACTPDPAPKPAAQPATPADEATDPGAAVHAERAPAEPVDPSAPASRRMLGDWTMKLDEVPDMALNDQLRRLKAQGVARNIGLEYHIDASKFDLVQRTPAGERHKSWYYEVIKENGDQVDLSRKGEDGYTQFVRITVSGDELHVGTGSDEVVLKRMKR
jgi:hypothetical protein